MGAKADAKKRAREIAKQKARKNNNSSPNTPVIGTGKGAQGIGARKIKDKAKRQKKKRRYY